MSNFLECSLPFVYGCTQCVLWESCET